MRETEVTATAIKPQTTGRVTSGVLMEKAAADARHPGRQPVIRWLELAVSPRWQQQGTEATVHPVHLGEARPCFGLKLDRRWLCSSEGAPAIFNSVAAATRFLYLLNLRRPASGERCDAGTLAPQRFQCFRLDANGLTVCGDCPAGSRARDLLTADDADWRECR